MARVPGYDSFQVSPQRGGSVQFDRPDTSGFMNAGRSVQQTGQALSSAGEAASRIVVDKMDEANRTRVTEAMNEARREALRLRFDEKDGYTTIKGGEVMPVGGKALADHYDEMLGTELSRIGNGLSNDAQRAMFAENAGSLRTDFYGQARAYEAQEYRSHQVSVFAGQADLAAEEISRSGGDVDRIDRTLGQIDSSVYEIGKLKGMSANETTSAINTARSSAITKAIASALSSDDPITAGSLFTRYKDQLVAEDRLRIEGPVQKETQSYAVLNAVDLATGDVAAVDGATIPVQGGRISSKFGVVRNDGEHHNGVDIAVPLGTPVRAPAAGEVIAVWEDAKNGKAVRIRHADGSISGYAHLSEQDVKKGDQVGAGQVFAKSGNSGKSTRPHLHWTLTKNGQKVDPLGKGSATAAPASAEDLFKQSLSYLSPEMRADPKVRDTLRAEATQRWSMRRQAEQDQKDQVVEQAQKWLIDNGGNFSAMPAGMRAAVSAVAPGEYDNLVGFGKALRSGANETNDAVYLALTDDDTLKNLTPKEFMALKPQLSDAHFFEFAKHRRALLKGETQTSPDKVNRATVNRVIGSRLATFGITTGDKATETDKHRAGAIRRYVDGQVIAEQRSRGKQLTDAETEQFVDGLFLKTIRYKDAGFFSTTYENKPLLGVTVDSIPAVDREGIEAALTRRGIALTDDNILQLYFEGRTRR